MCCLRQRAAVDIWLRLFNKTNMLLQSCTRYGRTSSVAAGGLSIFFFPFRPFPMTSAVGACVTLHWEGRSSCLRALGAAWYPHRRSDQKATIRAPSFGMKSPLYNMGDFIGKFPTFAPYPCGHSSPLGSPKILLLLHLPAGRFQRVDMLLPFRLGRGLSLSLLHP